MNRLKVYGIFKVVTTGETRANQKLKQDTNPEVKETFYVQVLEGM